MEQLAADCEIGKHYPAPIVDHLEAVRLAGRALPKFEALRPARRTSGHAASRFRKNAHRRPAKTG